VRVRALLLGFAATLATATAAPAQASVAVDGRLEPDYGSPIVVQTNLTAADDSSASNAGSNGWELDAAYGFMSAGVLHLMFPGNMLAQPNNIEPGTESSRFELFVDTGGGGQNVIEGAPYPLGDFDGMRFDAGFAPSFFLEAFAAGGPDFGQPYRLELFEQRFISGAWTTQYLGGLPFGQSGPLSGSSNPDSIAAAIDDSNHGGLTQGCGAGTPGLVTSGIELAIPLAALDNPNGAIRVCALYRFGSVTNQVLGTLPVGTCGLGSPGSVDFSSIAGDQYFTLPSTTSAPAPSSALMLAPRANPDRGLGVILGLSEAVPARLEALDLAGRRMLERDVAPSAGVRVVELASPGELPPGVYFVRLRQGGRALATRVTVIE